MGDSVVVSTISTAIAGFGDELMLIGGLGIGVAALPFLLRRGWGMVKGFIK